MKDHTRKVIAPDGGWSWFVCLGSGLITFSLRSLDPCFGLLFHDLLKDLKIDSTGALFITSLMESNLNFSGLFVAPLIKRYTYRKVAIFGALLSCTGLILTSQANSMFYIICTYSILGGFGTGFATAAAFVALNNYFQKKRGQAVGMSMSGTAIGLMLMPQIVHGLLNLYGFRGSTLIIGGLALHSIVGAILFQPVENHMKKAPSEGPPALPENEVLLEQNGSTGNNKTTETEMELRTTFVSRTIVSEEINLDIKRRRRESAASLSSVTSILDINCIPASDAKLSEIHERGENVEEDESSKEKKITVLRRIVNFFDLELLKDYVYLNIIIGLSLFYVSENNFKTMTTFFLLSIGMSRENSAYCLSIIFFADIVARLILPPVCDKFQFKKRTLFWICSMLVSISRSVFVEQTKGPMLTVMLVVIGFLRGATLVNMNLSVSENVTLDKLPAAFSIFMVSKGVFVTILGPLIGFVRDYTGSYKACSHTTTGLVFICFFSWSVEFALKWIRTRKTLESSPNIIANPKKSESKIYFNVMTNGKLRDTPDEGWAWIILASVAIINMSVLPIQQLFGFIFRNRLSELEISTTQTSLIIHLNSTIMCSMGLISGPMMRRLSWRCAAYLGSVIIVAGILFTAIADSLLTFIIAYCFLIGVGQGIIYPATSLSLNTYFREKRKIAMAISVTLTGLGPIIMPLFIVKLLDNHGTTGTLIILAGISTHAFIGASLLRSFRKEEKLSVETSSTIANDDNVKNDSKDKLTVAVTNDTVNHNNAKGPRNYLKQLDSTKEDTASEELMLFLKSEEPREEKMKMKRSVVSKCAKGLDLDLLRDSHYLIAVLGMSISFTSELNFNMMIPIILSDWATLEKEAVAQVISVQGIADIVGRLCIPIIAHKAGWTSRYMYLISLVGSSLARILLLAFKDTYGAILALSVLFGLAKGTKAVFQSLVIPDCVPLERLPAASGLLMVANGILSITLGPLIGGGGSNMRGSEKIRSDKDPKSEDAQERKRMLEQKCEEEVEHRMNESEDIEDQEDKRMKNEFVPPDGGWGWMIVMAAGFSNFCILPVLQSFGLIFRDKFMELEITSSETTTLINVNSAVTACIGLANGPLFRRFSYRQVSLTGALLCTISITILCTMKNFGDLLVFFSILYGAGTGITMSSNALALNTYFRDKRRIATGLSWTCTGMGPILMPQIITLLLPIYSVRGTVLICGGIAFNAVACALLLQPVSWHVKKNKIKNDSNKELLRDKIGTTCKPVLEEDEHLQECDKKKDKNSNSNDALLNESYSKSLENIDQNKPLTKERRSSQRFGSQYLYYEDKEVGASGIDVIGPGTPMMSRANDGWFSRKNASNASLTSSKTIMRENSQKTLSRYPSVSLSRQSSMKALSRGPSIRTLSRQNSETDGWKKKISNLQSSINSPLIILKESCEHPEDECSNENCKNEECVKKKLTQCFESNGIHISQDRLVPTSATMTNPVPIAEDKFNIAEEEFYSGPWYKRVFLAVVIFFDLDLLKDKVYVNLMLGITLANFSEINFSLLTPFILGEYGFSKPEVAQMMSILAGVDVATRITIPFIANYVGWENRTFFLVGVSTMAAGRIILAHEHSYYTSLGVGALIGVGKALRTIFMALVIPTHVPLSRLPAATGLQLLTSGIVFLIVGPIVGGIRDATGSYCVLLHCLNIFTYLTVISWTLEQYLSKRRKRNSSWESKSSA
ncbi:uncharacterized protein LOC107267613 [Cephus cinctus]|uniref:Uncharacterized protein LOC107267613 n=1 Tax=Cephus cinctus TaxID=211228 RepID=A0AAJ7RGX5_CEPCN|nr:uncharacterized protein LOC107267613 [Cephus cinctus]